jgi:hypothetical protein
MNIHGLFVGNDYGECNLFLGIIIKRIREYNNEKIASFEQTHVIHHYNNRLLYDAIVTKNRLV